MTEAVHQCRILHGADAIHEVEAAAATFLAATLLASTSNALRGSAISELGGLYCSAVGTVGFLLVSLDEIECETSSSWKSVFVAACFNIQHLLDPSCDGIDQVLDILLGVMGVQEQPHSILSLADNGEHNVASIEAVLCKVEGKVERVPWTTCPERDNVGDGHFVPGPILVHWHSNHALLVGLLVERVRGKRVQVEQGKIVQIFASLR